jgi:bifunctional DNA-binding transcriptional regulator/antitoxin component of YhaV-PrlF toxin-antitoxin module
MIDISKESAYSSYMIAKSTITKKNQTTLPKAVVEVLGVKPSDKLVYDIENGQVRLRARTGRLVDLGGAYASFGHKSARPSTQEEMAAAIGMHLAEQEARIKRRQRANRKSACS